MINVHFVGEGSRDEQSMPALVGSLTPTRFQATFSKWTKYRVHSHRKKLLLALHLAREAHADGLIASTDHDTVGAAKLGELQQARTEDREAYPPLPTALAVPDPHFEAWLLDDKVAVQKVYGIPTERIPNVDEVDNPKAELFALFRSSKPAEAGQTEFETLESLSSQLNPARCQHMQSTGLRAFLRDLKDEFRSIFDFPESLRTI